MHRIGIRMEVYNEWVRQKDLAGMAEQTHSEFATYLLRNLSEARQQSSPISTISPSHGKCKNYRFNLNFFHSTVSNSFIFYLDFVSPVAYSTPVQSARRSFDLRLQDDHRHCPSTMKELQKPPGPDFEM